MPEKRGEKAAVKTNPHMLRNRMRTFMTSHPLMRAQFILMAPILENCFRCHTFVRGVNTMENFIHSTLHKIHAAFILVPWRIA